MLSLILWKRVTYGGLQVWYNNSQYSVSTKKANYFLARCHQAITKRSSDLRDNCESGYDVPHPHNAHTW